MVKSFGSLDIGVRGRELRTASTRVRKVYISSNVNAALPITFFKCVLTALILLSQIPPKLGDFGGIKTHLICSCKPWKTLTLNSSVFISCPNSLN